MLLVPEIGEARWFGSRSLRDVAFWKLVIFLLEVCPPVRREWQMTTFCLATADQLPIGHVGVLSSPDVSEPWYFPLEYRCAWESFSEAFWRSDYVGFDGSVYRANLDLWQWHRQGWRDANVMYVLGAGYANSQHIRTATDQFNKAQVSNHRATARA
jgi:hypothetical protein